MGCQTEIAADIVAGGADYLLAVKDNQPTLSAGIHDFFDDHMEDDFARTKVSRHQTEEKGHGREELRSRTMCAAFRPVRPDRSRWAKLVQAIGMTINDTLRNGKAALEVRYYILSKKMSARPVCNYGTWPLGKSKIVCSWQLDVTFGEDQSRIRLGHADANFSILRRTALSMIKNNHSKKLGVKNKRLTAAWNEDYLLEILLGP